MLRDPSCPPAQCKACGRTWATMNDMGSCSVCGAHCCDKCAGSVEYKMDRSYLPVFVCFRCVRESNEVRRGR